MRAKIALFGVIAVLSIAAGIYIGMRQMAPEKPQANAADRLFALSLPNAANQPQALSQWRGKTLLVNFWATWCAPCVDEMPELSALQGEIASRNMQIIGIGIDSADNVRSFAQKYAIAYPLYVGGIAGTELTRQFGNQTGGLPFTVLIQPDGQISKTYIGRLKLEELRRDLLLPQAAAVH
jgi:thiol-disulfide isomerase/thioredoxin